MSLGIDVEKVAQVLLADGWHKVAPVGDGRSSFGMGAYEFQEPPKPEQNPVMHLKGGQEELIPSTGAHWNEDDGSRVFCPVTSILAVKYAATKKSQ